MAEETRGGIGTKPAEDSLLEPRRDAQQAQHRQVPLAFTAFTVAKPPLPPPQRHRPMLISTQNTCSLSQISLPLRSFYAAANQRPRSTLPPSHLRAVVHKGHRVGVATDGSSLVVAGMRISKAWALRGQAEPATVTAPYPLLHMFGRAVPKRGVCVHNMSNLR